MRDPPKPGDASGLPPAESLDVVAPAASEDTEKLVVQIVEGRHHYDGQLGHRRFADQRTRQQHIASDMPDPCVCHTTPPVAQVYNQVRSDQPSAGRGHCELITAQLGYVRVWGELFRQPISA